MQLSKGQEAKKGKPVGFTDISVPVLLLVPRCPGELFLGVLAWSSYLDF